MVTTLYDDGMLYTIAINPNLSVTNKLILKAAVIHLLLAIVLPIAVITGLQVYYFGPWQDPGSQFLAPLFLIPVYVTAIIIGHILSRKVRRGTNIGHVGNGLDTTLGSISGYIAAYLVGLVFSNLPVGEPSRWWLLATICVGQIGITFLTILLLAFAARKSLATFIAVIPVALAISIGPVVGLAFATSHLNGSYTITFPVYVPAQPQPQALSLNRDEYRDVKLFIYVELEDAKLLLREKPAPSKPVDDTTCATDYYINMESDETVDGARCTIVSQTANAKIYEMAYPSNRLDERTYNRIPTTHYLYFAIYDGTLVSTSHYNESENADYETFRAKALEILANLEKADDSEVKRLQEASPYN